MSVPQHGAATPQAQRVVDAIELEGLDPALVRLKVYEMAYGLDVALSAEEVQWVISQLERRMAERV